MTTNGEFEIFVPGRICLFGEHSDWAGGYRRINSSIESGCAIICGTNQGLHARIKLHSNQLIFHSSPMDGTQQNFSIPMEADLLLEEARKGGFFSYVAGVAYQILIHNKVKGLEIDNYYSDLPMKKGLSSSAAVCVLTARAFNLVYDLKMTTRGEMDYAYRGETTTPSRCGRMDQGCAFDSHPIMMEFDDDSLCITELDCGANLYFIIADLKAHKDTIKILTDLNRAYPFAQNDIDKNVQKCLGLVNKTITADVVDAIKKGDPQKVGKLMNQAQLMFDQYVAPACPDQLSAPILHRALSYPSLAPYVLGGKGIGSQGDGSVQFLVQDEKSQEAVIRILENELGFSCLRLTIPKNKKIRKAVITAAGHGTRLFPMTSVLRKEFLPVVDQDGRMLPLILANIEEIVHSGIEEICIVIQEQDRSIFQDFFQQKTSADVFGKLSNQARENLNSIIELGKRIEFRVQNQQRGLGDAVYQVRDWTNNEPFLLVLGDHLFIHRGSNSCIEQLVDKFQEFRTTLVGVQSTPSSEIGNFGAVGGIWTNETDKNILNISIFKEKPNLQFASEYLNIDGMSEGNYMAIFGLYVLMPSIFTELEKIINECPEDKEEIQLTSALEKLRQKEHVLGLVIEGEKIDVGHPFGYLSGLLKFSGRHISL
jgi:UTP-glucose-1-phosphate uridylyltransferase/mevalonate kinase